MYINLLKSKIQRATVTSAELHHKGSITIDALLMQAAGIYQEEKVQVVNSNTGDRFETYAVPGAAGKGDICLNGAAARLAEKGDQVIIMAYCWLEESEAPAHQSKVVRVDENNQPVHL